MSTPPSRQLAVSLAPVLLAAVALPLTRSFYLPAVPLPWPVLAAFCCLLTLASLHRPMAGVSLSLGALALPPLITWLSPAGVATCAAGSFAAAELGRRLLWKLSPTTPAERRSFLRVLEGAGRSALAVLAAAFAARAAGWAEGTVPAGPVALAGGVYLAVFTGMILTDRALRRPGSHLMGWLILRPLLLDAGAWLFGTALALASVLAGGPLAGTLAVGFALIAFEAARASFLQGAFAHRAVELEQVTLAGERMASSGVELAELAGRIRTECLRLLPFHWFQLEMADGRSFAAGPSGLIEEGAPTPDPQPPPLPGMHRRTHWRVLERTLDVDERPLATLRFWCDPRRFATSDQRLLDNLRPQLALWVHRAELDREAREDTLTGLQVRRVLERVLGDAFQRCYEGGGQLAVMLVDIDHFKRINDTHGHPTGDQALVAVARALEAFRRDGELVARFGGEEFAVYLPGHDGAAALYRAERLRQAIAALVVGDETGATFQLTASLGVAAFPELTVSTPQQLLALADEALYHAKRSGRNRALLSLGLGRFRTPAGEELTSPTERTVEPPRIFV